MKFDTITTKVFGERLKEVREDKGYTQEELCKMVGTSKATISKYENNINPPKMELAKALAKKLNISFNWLIGYSDNKYMIEDYMIADIYNKLSDSGKQELYNFANYLLTKEQEVIEKLEG